MADMLFYKNEYSSTGADSPYCITAGGVVYRKQGGIYKYLLLGRNDSGVKSYHLPKGTLNINETLEHCALREIAEEAGVNVKIKTYIGGRQAAYEYKGKKYDKMLHYFATEYVSEANDMDSEHDFKIWCNYEEALNKLQSNVKQEYIFLTRCKDFLNNYEQS